MQNKRLILVMGILIPVVGAAAFIGGRFLTQRVGLAGSVSVNIIPAVELPTTLPEVTGPFVGRRDNTIIVETKSLDAGGVVLSPGGTGRESGPEVEIVITSETIIYRETTRLRKPLSGGNQTIQQTVEESTLDDLNSQCMVMVWGRKSGDRIVAEMLMYSHTPMIKRALFEGCETCP